MKFPWTKLSERFYEFSGSTESRLQIIERELKATPEITCSGNALYGSLFNSFYGSSIMIEGSLVDRVKALERSNNELRSDLDLLLKKLELCKKTDSERTYYSSCKKK